MTAHILPKQSALVGLALRVLWPLAVTLAGLSSLAGCGAGAPERRPDASAAEPPYLRALGETLDESVDPCGDFYRFACGGWLARTTLPPADARLGRDFEAVAARNADVLRAILDAAARREQAGTADALGRFYGECLDEAAVERAGLAPLAPTLGRIDGVTGPVAFFEALAAVHRLDVGAAFVPSVAPDPDRPARNVLRLDQGTFGLSDVASYRAGGARASALRSAYRAHVARMLGLLGDTPAGARRGADAVVRVEAALAGVAASGRALADPVSTANVVGPERVAAMLGDAGWQAYLRALALDPGARIDVATPAYLAEVGRLSRTLPPADLRAYLRWQLVHGLATDLPSAFRAEDFRFFGEGLEGRTHPDSRWRRCVTAADRYLPTELGRGFVARAFDKERARRARQVAERVRAGLEATLRASSWLDPVTARHALEKIEAVRMSIGHPDPWPADAASSLAGHGFLDDVLRARASGVQRRLFDIGRPVDRSEWSLTASTPNAYYDLILNEMVVPAGILQPPLFTADMPPPLTLGGIGVMIGHELSHGLDDQGRKVDARGRLRAWWSPAAVAAYDRRIDCIARQYGAIEVQPGHRLNGRRTLGETVADWSGLRAAHRALETWLADAGDDTRVGRFSAEQAYFIAFGQTWCMLETPAEELRRLGSDAHPPASVRVNGAVSNDPAFWRAFGCAEGTAMHPTATCPLW